MKTRICLLIAAFVFVLISPFPAAAMDCDRTAGIGYDLHTSRHSSSLDRSTLEQARKYYEETLSNCPGYCRKQPELCNNLGDVYKRLGMEAWALSLFRTAAREKPDYGDALFDSMVAGGRHLTGRENFYMGGVGNFFRKGFAVGGKFEPFPVAPDFQAAEP